MTDILDYFDQETSYVGKINQNDISVPITYAAMGNENYIDAYNTAKANGFEISDTEIPGVFTKKEQRLGQYGEGNIDLYKRPIVKNKDGSISTVRSMSFSENGQEILIPTISDNGDVLSEDEAIQNYRQTGKYLGKFSSIEEADTYAQKLHEEQQMFYKGRMEGVPTGFAANLPNKTFTRQELEQISDYYAAEYGVPAGLARAVIKQESGWNPKAKSKVGAMGMMQLMPSTAKNLGVIDAWDPAQNIQGGMKYLAKQYSKFGSWEAALAAYNAGPGAVQDYLEGTNKTGQNPLHRKGVMPWAGTGYKETQNYVKNIMAMYNRNSYPIYFDFKDNPQQYINDDTGLLSTTGLDKFINTMNTGNGYKDNIVQILTNRPELLENKEEYSDFAKYRKMKTADGKPLFAKGSFDGFQVMMKNPKTDKGLNRNAIPALAEDMVKTQTDIIPTQDKAIAQSLLELFADRTNNTTKEHSNKFGLANLTSKEYEEYGVPISMQQNPVLQARVLHQEFQRACDILGSENKAIYALLGGKLKDGTGKIQSWEEIKQDRENFMKKYFMQPSEDKKTRTAINEQVEIFSSLCRKHRGIA